MAIDAVTTVATSSSGGFGGRAWLTARELWKAKVVGVAVVYLLVLIVSVVFAPVVAPHSPTTIDIFNRLQPPAWSGGGSATHLLGTDSLGRDILSRLIYGGRISLVIGASVVLIAGTAGTLLGIFAGYKGGRWDAVLMRFADAQLAFPGLLLVLLVLAFIGHSVGAIIGVISAYGWMIYARLVRGAALQLKATPAIQSAQLLGCSIPRILFRHLMPNLYSMLLTQGMLELARVILVEAALSYLGLGIQPPNASWGLMVSENQDQIADAWWTVAFPGLALSATVLSINLVANWLRLQTDPLHQNRYGAPRTTRRSPRVTTTAAEAFPVDADATPAPVITPLLELEDIDVTFHTREGDTTAVRGATLRILPGETIAVVGESGSGKSSLALSLIDLIPSPGQMSAGRIRWNGSEITAADLRALRGRDITMIFQDPMTSLNPLVPVGRQVAETLVKHRGLSWKDAKERAAELFSLVGIPSPRERLEQFPFQLSGGLRQRVMIASALAPEPKLIIADEPTTALDATIQAQILELVAELQRTLGIAVVLITHDLGVVARVADRVVVMYGGRLVEEAPAADLYVQPRHRYTEALLAAAPSVETTGRYLPSIPGHPPTRLAEIRGCPFVPRCAFATAECEEMPAFVYSGPAHKYACWHPAGSVA